VKVTCHWLVGPTPTTRAGVTWKAMSLTAEGRRRRARAAALRRHHPDKPELAADDQRALKVDRAEKLVRELVDTFPPLTAEQRGRLALLLQGGGGDAA
jgi:hypothetical protein